MSSAASWSYTAELTVWPFIGKADAWEGGESFGPPFIVMGDYKFAAKTMINAQGKEFTTSGMYYTEDPKPKVGDRIAVGNFLVAATPPRTAQQVKARNVFADTLERIADDYMLVT